MDWFRSYHGAPLDAKHVTIAKRSETQPGVAAAVWWALLDFASQNTDRGSVADFDCEVVADFFGWSVETVGRVVQVMRDMRLITHDRITNWEKRQPRRNDDSTERVRAHRERQKSEGNAPKRSVTHGNAREEQRREDVTTPPSSPRTRENDADALRALFPAVADALPPEDGRDPLLEVMQRVPDPRAYLAEMAAALTGMHGTTLDAAQLRVALIDWLANQEQPNLRRFRGYLRGVTPKITGPPRTSGHRPSNAQQTYDTALAALEGRTA